MDLEPRISPEEIINYLLQHRSGWLVPAGEDSEIVLSSRVRLARNLSDFLFPNRADQNSLTAVREKIFDALAKIDRFSDRWFIDMDALSEVDRHFLVERHLISYEHTVEGFGKGLAITPDETVAIMINEEDHLRMQVLLGGFNIDKAWEEMNAIDDSLSQLLEFAFSPEFGYLTACPTNVGTGLRGSLMMHLPALVMTKQINQVLQTISQLNFAARGLYGEGTQALGNIFQISNQACLGYTEVELLESIKRLARQIIDQERSAREKILRTSRMMLEDRIWRAYGLLKNARIMNSAEAFEYLSMVRLGLDLELIKEVDLQTVNDLFIIIQPAHLQKISGRKLSSRQRDIKRANILRNRLGNGAKDNVEEG